MREISSSPQLDAELLMAHVLGENRAYVLAHGDETLSWRQLRAFAKAVKRRAAGVPLAYITGVKEFYGREFAVDERVLVPRPETEELVEKVISYCRTNQLRNPRILDIGTGSGCIAITLAKELPKSTVTAMDVDANALEVAQENVQKHKARVTLRSGDLFDLETQFAGETYDVIVSNPPYVDMSHVVHIPETAGLTHEPQHALTPTDREPFAAVAALIEHAPQFVHTPGLLTIEIGADQGAKAKSAATEAHPNAQVEIRKDLSGRDRFLFARFS